VVSEVKIKQYSQLQVRSYFLVLKVLIPSIDLFFGMHNSCKCNVAETDLRWRGRLICAKTINHFICAEANRLMLHEIEISTTVF